jgi:hypothetical protein
VFNHQPYPLISFTSTIESLTNNTDFVFPFIFRNPKGLLLYKRSQSDSYEVFSLLAFLQIDDWLKSKVSTPLLCSVFRFFNLLAVYSHLSLTALFHAVSAYRVFLSEFCYFNCLFDISIGHPFMLLFSLIDEVEHPKSLKENPVSRFLDSYSICRWLN